jgi:hypothetical protein
MSQHHVFSFLPWLRRGLANDISGQAGHRATVTVDLEISGTDTDGGVISQPVSKDVEIYGPGDVVGIDAKNIIRTEPRNWVTNFESNYLAFIDFYDEDLPWRYSPDTPTNDRLQPWMALIILKEDEFEALPLVAGQPLPALKFLSSDPLAALPAVSELWAWSHVQLNDSVIGDAQRSDNHAAIATEVENMLTADPDMGFSRIICPRRPEANAAYHAFLVPTYESGRLAGLGREIPGTVGKSAPAWSEGSIPTELPYYHRFYFRTGGQGDFEFLVRLLEAKPVPSTVGRREIDVLAPGANLSGIMDPELEGVLLLGGALRVPDANLTPVELTRLELYRTWDGDNSQYPHPFQEDLAGFINLTDEYLNDTAENANTGVGVPDNPDPLVTAPLYGRWHSLTNRLLEERDGSDLPNRRNWVHQLNLDPTHRTSAGFGTTIIQDGQEDFMRASWEQVGEIMEANRRIRLAQLAREVSLKYYQVHLLAPQLALAPAFRARLNTFRLQLTSPLHRRVLVEDATVTHTLRGTHLQPALLSPLMRKALRPRGRLIKTAFPEGTTVRPDEMIDRAAAGDISAAPPREVPAGLPTLDAVGESAGPGAATTRQDKLVELLRRYPWLRWLPLILLGLLWLAVLLVASVADLGLTTLLIISLVLVLLFFYLTHLLKNPPEPAISPLDPTEYDTADVNGMPSSSDFRITEVGEDFRPNQDGTDSDESRRYKLALGEYFELVGASATAAPSRDKVAIDPTRLGETIIAQLDPAVRIPQRVIAGLRIPGVLVAQQVAERFTPVMAYPRIDTPMYEPLAKKNPGWFLPNIDQIPQNCITLLETNQEFIEAYMVGLNHEMSRELLWREFPTDQRGSVFRKFWEGADLLADEGLSEEERREKNYDIPKLHRWPRASKLGQHDLREIRRQAENPGAEPRDEAVLVIRGELLKKYPNAIIYAQRARWQLKTVNGVEVPDNQLPRQLLDGKENVKMPIYEAQVQPDIYFFGFDLTVEEARGEKGDDAGDDAGWFFVIQEEPVGTRFGLDLGDGSVPPEVWNDLNWEHVGVPEGGVLRVDGTTTSIPLDGLELTNDDPPTGEDAPKAEQREEDNAVHWNDDMNAADLAYVLFQVPVLVAVHASDMIKQAPEN